MGKAAIDYSLYLVTGRELLPEGKDYYESLEEALQGGVSVVQVREKDADTGEFVEIARRTKELTDKYNVPLFINDRVDVFLAVRPAGLHIGQSDLPLARARELVGPDAVIGVSVSNADEARAAVAEGADYVGVGAVWDTGSKDVSAKLKLGPEGAGALLDLLDGVPAVAIGGIHPPNVPQLLHGAVSPVHRVALDGVAVISAIVSSADPRAAAAGLRAQVDSFKRARAAANPQAVFSGPRAAREPAQLVEQAAALMAVVRGNTPLVHQLTNNVVINDSANATLAVGASPIMATNPFDVKDLSPAIGALLVNFGTITDKAGMLVAGREANVNRKPVVYDPVAVGATSFRRSTSKELLAHWQPTVIKGNPAEIGALAESTEVASRGVDAVGGGFANPGEIVRVLARRKNAIVVMTGKHDYISDGETVLKTSNGVDLLEVITGSGCMTGTIVATFCAAARLHYLASNEAFENDSQLVQGDHLVGALAGVLVFNIAAELAAARPDVKGPGTFRAALIDELYNVRAGDVLARAKVEVLA
ncbi:thiamine biosynthetic bifunctional enzyme [Vanrija albida]|uniref:Thiamine biosynthetic bifunctional enzyme n=1 Tax=Vanrija albida TaxID=181172 RepID=A0ABR3Q236_9TREE